MEQAVIDFLLAKVPGAALILACLGGLVVIGQTIVALTPSPDDDAKLAKVFEIPILGPILKAVAAFAPIQKK